MYLENETVSPEEKVAGCYKRYKHMILNFTRYLGIRMGMGMVQSRTFQLI
jgi:hypothetical protein